MKNFLRSLSIAFAVGVFFSGCDEFLEDAVPQGDDILKLEAEKYTLPGTPIYFNLEWLFEYDDVVSYDIELDPSRGEIYFMDRYLMVYHPDKSFTEGSDLFSVRLLDKDSAVLDIDSVSVAMVQSLDDLPCFNGALPDFFELDEKEEEKEENKVDKLYLDILANDGICFDQISGYEIKILDDEGNKIELKNDSIIFSPSYEENKEYESFFYHLIQYDEEGNEHKSVAKVIISYEGKDDDDDDKDCEEVFPNKSYELEKPLNSEYAFKIYYPEEECETGDWTAVVRDVYNGTASFSEVEMKILFSPGNEDDSVSNIYYDILLGEDTLSRSISIFYYDDDKDDDEECIEAYDDEYYYYAGIDSTGNPAPPFYFYPGDNDEKCTDDYKITILELPDVGEVEVIDGKKIKFEVFEEFAGPREVKMEYEICGEGECDDAYVYITVEK